MDNRNIASKSKIISSLIWKLLERCGAQGVQLLVQILLARLLDPEDFGVLTLLVIFVNLANVFIQTGFSTSLIQKKEVDEVDLSSVLFASLGVAAVLYVVLYLCAPVISRFYELPELTTALRVIAISLFFGALNSVQGAVIARNMEFRKAFVCGLSSTVVSGMVGVAMAYAGFGYWSLVVQQLTSVITACIIMWFAVKWRPILAFSFARIKVLFRYGWKLLVSDLLNTFMGQLSGLIIGKKYSTESLAFYNRGQQFPSMIAHNLDASVKAVMLPAYSQHQDEPQVLRAMMRRSIQLSTYLIFPMLFGLSAVSEPLVRLLLTDKWLPAVPYMQVLCLSFAFYPIHSSNLQAINAMGHSEIFLKLEIIKKAYGLVILLIAVQFGPMAMASSAVIGDLIGTFVNAAPNKKLLNYSYLEQWKDIMPAMTLSIVMMVVVRLVGLLKLAPLPLLILEVAVGAAVYILGSSVFKLESFRYLLGQIRKK